MNGLWQQLMAAQERLANAALPLGGDGELQLLWPLVLALAPLPLVASYLLPSAAIPGGALRTPFAAQLRSLGAVSRPQGKPALQMAAWGIWLLLLLSAARPISVGAPIDLPVLARDMLLTVDISGSMKERDMIVGGQRTTRLGAVKAVVGDFVKRRRGDRLGLILFGTHPYLQCPLSFDLDAVATLLREASIGIAGEYTSIGDAIGLSVRRLRERPAKSRVVILLTDGVDSGHGKLSPERATQLAVQAGIRIHTIGFGGGGLLRRATVDEDSLRAIAQATGGRYFRARDARQLAKIYAALEALEPIEQEGETFRPERSLLHWPLGSATVLSLALALALTLGAGRSRMPDS